MRVDRKTFLVSLGALGASAFSGKIFAQEQEFRPELESSFWSMGGVRPRAGDFEGVHSEQTMVMEIPEGHTLFLSTGQIGFDDLQGASLLKKEESINQIFVQGPHTLSVSGLNGAYFRLLPGEKVNTEVVGELAYQAIHSDEYGTHRGVVQAFMSPVRGEFRFREADVNSIAREARTNLEAFAGIREMSSSPLRLSTEQAGVGEFAIPLVAKWFLTPDGAVAGAPVVVDGKTLTLRLDPNKLLLLSTGNLKIPSHGVDLKWRQDRTNLILVRGDKGQVINITDFPSGHMVLIPINGRFMNSRTFAGQIAQISTQFTHVTLLDLSRSPDLFSMSRHEINMSTVTPERRLGEWTNPPAK